MGGGGVWSKAGQSQQEGPDLDMVVKFHWLKGGLLHWLLSVELIIHMVGGREWKPPTAKEEEEKKHTKDVATGEETKRLVEMQFRPHNSWKFTPVLLHRNTVCLINEWRRTPCAEICAAFVVATCLYWSRRVDGGLGNSSYLFESTGHRWLRFTCSPCQRGFYSHVIKAAAKSSLAAVTSHT